MEAVRAQPQLSIKIKIITSSSISFTTTTAALPSKCRSGCCHCFVDLNLHHLLHLDLAGCVQRIHTFARAQPTTAASSPKCTGRSAALASAPLLTTRSDHLRVHFPLMLKLTAEPAVTTSELREAPELVTRADARCFRLWPRAPRQKEIDLRDNSQASNSCSCHCGSDSDSGLCCWYSLQSSTSSRDREDPTETQTEWIRTPTAA